MTSGVVRTDGENSLLEAARVSCLDNNSGPVGHMISVSWAVKF